MQIQVLVEFESSIFDEVHVYIGLLLKNLSDWEMIIVILQTCEMDSYSDS